MGDQEGFFGIVLYRNKVPSSVTYRGAKHHLAHLHVKKVSPNMTPVTTKNKIELKYKQKN